MFQSFSVNNWFTNLSLAPKSAKGPIIRMHAGQCIHIAAECDTTLKYCEMLRNSYASSRTTDYLQVFMPRNIL